jgi:hypothetical protein
MSLAPVQIMRARRRRAQAWRGVHREKSGRENE